MFFCRVVKRTLWQRKKPNIVVAIQMHKSNKGYNILLMNNFAINNRYLCDRMSFIRKNTVINKIVPDFMDTL